MCGSGLCVHNHVRSQPTGKTHCFLADLMAPFLMASPRIEKHISISSYFACAKPYGATEPCRSVQSIFKKWSDFSFRVSCKVQINWLLCLRKHDPL